MTNMEFKQKQLESTIETYIANKTRLIKKIDMYTQEITSNINKLNLQKEDYQKYVINIG